MLTDLMLDLETLSVTSGAAILQIAAVAFNPVRPWETCGTPFNVYVTDSTGDIDVKTVAWWLTQRGAAAMGANILEQGKTEADALRAFVEYYNGYVPFERVWAHGATFDLPILDSAFRRHGLKAPWGYRAPRDTRTLYDLTPGGMPEIPADPEQQHDALYDCQLQIKCVCEAVARSVERRDTSEAISIPLITSASK